MNYSYLTVACFIFLAVLALIGLIILWWNPNKINRKEKDFADKILKEVKKDRKRRK